MSHILIVSENNELSLAIKFVLRREGHDVEIASTFCDAESYLYQGHHADVVMIDADATHHCRSASRASEKLKGISGGRIIYLATKSDEDGPRKGSDSTLYKPFTACDVQREVRDAIAKS